MSIDNKSLLEAGENSLPNFEPSRKEYSKAWFFFTCILAVFTLASPLVSNELDLMVQYLPATIDAIFVDVILIFCFPFCVLFMGPLIGYKNIVLASFFFIGLWTILAHFSGHIHSDLIRHFVTVSQQVPLAGTLCIVMIFIYNFRSLGKINIFLLAVIYAVLTIGFNIALAFIPRLNWLPITYGVYGFVMVPICFFSVPRTPTIREVRLKDFCFHSTGIFGLLVVHATWREYFHGFQAVYSALFSAGCIMLGIICAAIGSLGNPLYWQETYKLLREKRREFNAKFSP
ncbi:hypothetical protein ACI3LY_003404 [Candidozyma auris]|uniref:Transporter n=2 Tax=Candidozyma auris TaxID=498019 RepID=A0AB36VXS1_CANAR|nr:hypothetical protein QG37_08365 [[Candida] auris]PIS48193.1 hypothetical protein CJI97_005650 [[Candida] auris]PIS52484.1 hypothetical protein B9J08_004101 [[Candida] auris]QWW21256.1 hypothetical protein CA7LBN_000002 [[Candida] auris]